MPVKKVMKSMKKQKATTPRMSDVEVQMVRRMHTDEQMSPAEISRVTGRDVSVIYRRLKLLKAMKSHRRPGRPNTVTEKQVDKMEVTLRAMVKKAKGTKEVTVDMLKTRCRVEACDKTVLEKLHERGIWFRKLRNKPLLTEDDIATRKQFAKDYKAKRKPWWLSHVDIHIDNKNFPVATNANAREHEAKRSIRGVFRKDGEGLDEGYVRPPKGSQNPHSGQKSALISCGVGPSGVIFWEEVKTTWGGEAAKDLYTMIGKKLRAKHPHRRKFRMLEDNDPTGYKSSKGIAAKEEQKLEVFAIPKRSPDLNVLDYAIWTEVNKRMRQQEKDWPKSKRETREEYLRRLRKTAMGLPKAFVRKCIGDMRRRCQRLFDKKGGLFEEGGRSERQE